MLLLVLAVFLGGCAGESQGLSEAETETMKAERAHEAAEPVIGLILTSQDGEANETIISCFQEKAGEAGAKLWVRIPEVSEEDALEAAGLTESFVLCEVDPIEFQMLFVNEMVAENVDVIAIYANHDQALEPVLSAARAVGIRVCAFGRRVTEECRDCYAEVEEAAAAAVSLLEESMPAQE